MQHDIVVELAGFLEVPEYQVRAWDQGLVEYFVRHREQFLRFKHGTEDERYWVWFEGYRHARGFSAAAR